VCHQCSSCAADNTGRYDAEHERQMQHMKTALHSQAVSNAFYLNTVAPWCSGEAVRRLEVMGLNPGHDTAGYFLR